MTLCGPYNMYLEVTAETVSLQVSIRVLVQLQFRGAWQGDKSGCEIGNYMSTINPSTHTLVLIADLFQWPETKVHIPYSGIFSRVQNFAESKQKLPE